MVLDHSPVVSSCERVIGNLDLSPATNSFRISLNNYIIACAGEKSPERVDNYHHRRLLPFVSFLESQHLEELCQVQPQRIRLYILTLQQSLNGKRRDLVTVNSHYRVLHTFFNWLVAESIIKESPFYNIKASRVPKKVVKPFRKEDKSKLLFLCSANTFLAIRNRALVLAMLDTSLRLNEVSKVQLGDVDFEDEIITVMGKGSKERVVRIGKNSRKALLRYLLTRKVKPDPYTNLWITEEHRPMTKDGVKLTIKKLCHRAQVSARPGTHTFRHTFGTQALINGADIREVQSLLGHSTLTMTLKYVATANSEQAVVSHRKFSPVDRLGLR